jgi:UDP-glucose 4-epimerase
MSICLVTGGAGFIGSNLVDRLISLNHEVRVIDNESSEVHETFYWNYEKNGGVETSNFQADICNYEEIEPYFNNVEYVFHLAAESRIQPGINSPLQTIKTNTLGTANVLECARKNNVKRLIYSTTSSYYGLKNKVPNTETQSKDCLNPYSVSKVAGEELCKIYNDLYNLKTISLRYFNVYGPREPLRGPYAPVVGLFLRQVLSDQSVTIVGDGLQRRDFTHVDDVLAANLLAAFSPAYEEAFGETYNVGSGRNFSMLELAKMVGAKNIDFLPQRPGEARETLANIDKIRDAFGWAPKKNLKDYIGEILEKSNFPS